MLADQTIGGFLGQIASDAPAPGAGSAAAIALALGLACARKAIAITVAHHGGDPDLAALGERLGGLSDQAMAGGAADISCFSAYITAMRRSKDDPGRREAERHALADLVAVGKNLIALADEATALLQAARDLISPIMANDIVAALALIAAARTIHDACTTESERAAAAINP